MKHIKGQLSLFDYQTEECELSKQKKRIPKATYEMAKQLVEKRGIFRIGFLQSRLHISANLEDAIHNKMKKEDFLDQKNKWKKQQKFCFKKDSISSSDVI